MSSPADEDGWVTDPAALLVVLNLGLEEGDDMLWEWVSSGPRPVDLQFDALGRHHSPAVQPISGYSEYKNPDLKSRRWKLVAWKPKKTAG